MIDNICGRRLFDWILALALSVWLHPPIVRRMLDERDSDEMKATRIDSSSVDTKAIISYSRQFSEYL